jgi:radical SAM protein, TIGR01212 family
MNKRYNSLDEFYKNKFGCKIAKISLNGNFTCPNIDGTKAYGGCTFCLAGSSMYGGNKQDSLLNQFYTGIKKVQTKWKNAKYIAYFQANTNTYDTVDNLKKKFEPFLNIPNVVGIDISTRADSINEDILNYLEELNKKTFLTVELGLQTIHEKTRKTLNRFEDLEDIIKISKELKKRNINTVVHIINGFKDETKENMLETIKFVNKLNVDGIKIHMLFIEKGTKMSQEYIKNPFHILTLTEFVDIVCDQIELLNKNIIIYRLTGDPNKDLTIEPKWTHKKFVVLNEIDKELKKRNSFQGIKSK